MLRRILLWLLGDSVVRREEYRDEILTLRDDLVGVLPINKDPYMTRDTYTYLKKETLQYKVQELELYRAKANERFSANEKDFDALLSHLNLSWEDVPAERRLVKGEK